MRVRPLHAREHAGNGFGRVLVELGLARMMGQGGNGNRNDSGGDDGY
jgi:hypothetical protein